MKKSLIITLLLSSLLIVWCSNEERENELQSQIYDLEYQVDDLESEISDLQYAIDECNSNIDNAKRYAWESYEEMGEALDDLDNCYY